MRMSPPVPSWDLQDGGVGGPGCLSWGASPRGRCGSSHRGPTPLLPSSSSARCRAWGFPAMDSPMGHDPALPPTPGMTMVESPRLPGLMLWVHCWTHHSGLSGRGLSKPQISHLLGQNRSRQRRAWQWGKMRGNLQRKSQSCRGCP